MTRAMGWEAEFRRSRRRPLDPPDARPSGTWLGRDRLAGLLPHRDPLLLLDAVTGVDVDGGRIAGVRRLDPDDPVFAGHFPGTPVYPGSLQLEMAGQLALCLHRLSARGCGTGPSRPTLVTGVLRAAFLRTLAPGDTATVLARRLEEDDLVGTALVQTLRDEEVCSAAVLQVCFP